MDQQIIAFAVPFFFVLIASELVYDRVKGRGLYRLHDTLADLGCGIGSQMVNLLIALGFGVVYTWVYERVGIFELHASSALTWVLAMVAFDFCFYWWHRASHGVAFMWAAHVVHHQSEDYNLAVALRQAWFTTVTGLPFYLLMAVLGFSPVIFATVGSINLLYQFWIHTQVIRSLGPLEAVLNTPSHHRVHHAVNPQYLDKNHGGMFILFDKLFGTFAREVETPVYGTVDRHKSWNPIFANFDYWAKLWREFRRMPSLETKLWVWFAPPGWAPPELGGSVVPPPVDPAAVKKWDTPTPPKLRGYATAQFAVVFLASGALLAMYPTLPWWIAAPAASWIVLSTATVTGVIEQRRWVQWVEPARYVILFALAVSWVAFQGAPPWVAALVLVASAVGAVSFKWAWASAASPARLR
jgi:sterol desaturase/sphingolipid hydroxylase (fatty acid hydroxylase superfamily)